MAAYIELSQQQLDAWNQKRQNHDFGNKDVRPVRYYDGWVIPVAAYSKTIFMSMRNALQANNGPFHPSNLNIIQLNDADFQTYWESVVLAAESSAPLETEDTSDKKNKKK